jgi:signal transduction histidine kinase
MAQHAASQTSETSLPSLKPLIRWIRSMYQAPFRSTFSPQDVRELERTRRAALQRVTTFTITVIMLVFALPITLLLHAGYAAYLPIVATILIGLISLGCNARGWITTASTIYFYGYLLLIYLPTLFISHGLAATDIEVFNLVNVALLLGGLTLPQWTIWPNCALVILASSLTLSLTPLNHTSTLGTLPAFLSFLDTTYLLTTSLAWLGARISRIGIARLVATLEQEQQLVALKDLFIVSANHELRTPIMTLSNNLELLSRTLGQADPQEHRQMLDRAQRASKDLKDILSNVLDAGVSEAEVSKRLRLEALSVRTVVQQALDTFDPRELGEPWLERTTLKSRPVTLDIPPDLVIRADGGRTRQVLVNLLSNALKYSDPTTPIAISAHHLESNGRPAPEKPLVPAGSWVQINVRDWGLGVPPREQGLLFQRFVRLSRDAASATRGTGVGLYLCRVLIQAMGGHIWVESTGTPGQGSVFAFVLPAAQGSTA